MDKILWSESLEVGITLIDKQHREWIEHYNSVVEAVSANEGASQVVKTLGYLIDYTDTHFKTEEKVMQHNIYPDYEDHKRQHDKLVKTLSSLVSEYRDEGPTNIILNSMEIFLNNWLLKHIQEVDSKFIDFIKENKIEVSE